MLKLKEILKNVVTYSFMVFYKVVYIEGDKCGYYLLKRKWIWFICFIPILIYRSFINIILEISNILNDIFSYESRWISVNDKKPKKLNFKQKKYITERLMS